MVTFIGERIPTGKSVNGSDINYITPGLEFWWNFAPKWVARGGTSIDILTGRKSATSVYVNQLAVGRYLTTKDARYFKELEIHVTATALSDVSGGAGGVNDIYIFPGFRFGLGGGEVVCPGRRPGPGQRPATLRLAAAALDDEELLTTPFPRAIPEREECRDEPASVCPRSPGRPRGPGPAVGRRESVPGPGRPLGAQLQLDSRQGAVRFRRVHQQRQSPPAPGRIAATGRGRAFRPGQTAWGRARTGSFAQMRQGLGFRCPPSIAHAHGDMAATIRAEVQARIDDGSIIVREG